MIRSQANWHTGLSNPILDLKDALISPLDGSGTADKITMTFALTLPIPSQLGFYMLASLTVQLNHA
jgi:hypothetical protein